MARSVQNDRLINAELVLKVSNHMAAFHSPSCLNVHPEMDLRRLAH